MNRLYPEHLNVEPQPHEPSVFVGGPIQHALRGSSMTSEAQSPIRAIHSVVHSLGVRLLSAHIAERFGGDTHAFTPSDVARRDYRWMSLCSLFVAVLPCDDEGRLIRSDGTHIELGWASALAKPILVLAHQHTHPQLSHLVKGLGTVASADLLDLGAALTIPRLLQDAILARLQRTTTALA